MWAIFPAVELVSPKPKKPHWVLSCSIFVFVFVFGGVGYDNLFFTLAEISWHAPDPRPLKVYWCGPWWLFPICFIAWVWLTKALNILDTSHSPALVYMMSSPAWCSVDAQLVQVSSNYIMAERRELTQPWVNTVSEYGCLFWANSNCLWSSFLIGMKRTESPGQRLHAMYLSLCLCKDILSGKGASVPAVGCCFFKSVGVGHPPGPVWFLQGPDWLIKGWYDRDHTLHSVGL